MKLDLAKKGIRVPHHVLIDKEELRKDKEAYADMLKAKIGLPMFCKLISGSCSVGGANARTDEELKSALEMIAESEKPYEIEEYIEGEIFHCDYLIIKDQIKAISVYKNPFPPAETLEGKPFSVLLVPRTDPLYKKTLSYIKGLSKALAPAHNMSANVELFNTKDGLVLLEVNYRRTGNKGLYGNYMSFGYNAESISIDLQWATPVWVHKDDLETDYEEYTATLEYPCFEGKVVRKRELPKELTSQVRIDWLLRMGMCLNRLLRWLFLQQTCSY